MRAAGRFVIAGAVVAAVLAPGSPSGAQQPARTQHQRQQQRQAGQVDEPAAAPVVPAGGAAGNLDVVTAAQIEAAAAADLKAALALVPTLLVEDSGGPAGVATLSLRGSTSRQVLVLLDGQRLATAQSSFFNLDDLPVPIERVERVEVLPSPASALYGADAIGGVVNIVTRPVGTTPEVRVSYGLGGEGEQRIAGGGQYGVGVVGLRFDGRLHSGDGYRANGDFDVKNFAVAATVVPDPWGLDVRYTSFERDAGVPGPAALPSPNARQSDSRDGVRAGFTYLPGSGWGVRAGVFTANQTLEYEDPDPPEPDPAAPASPIDSRHENSSRGFDARWDFDTGRGELYTLGFDWVEDRIESTSDGDHDTGRWGLVFQDQWRAGGWSAVGAIRRDEHTAYGEETSPSLSVAWEAEGWKLWAAWERGFRAPNFDDLHRDEQFLQGNPDLKPETATAYEGGVQFGAAGALARAVVFRREVRNLIRWADDDGDLVHRPENLAEAQIAGYEAEVVYRPSATLAIPVGLQQIAVEDAGTGERIPGSVRSLWRAALQSTGGSFGWSLEYAVTDRGEYRLRDEAWRYAVLNAAVSWKGALGSFPVRVGLRGENLLDRAYETVEGYPMPGTSFFLEARVGL